MGLFCFYTCNCIQQIDEIKNSDAICQIYVNDKNYYLHRRRLIFVFHSSKVLLLDTMKSKAKTVKEYLAEVSPDQLLIIKELRKTIQQSLPEGFVETIGYGMISYVVPHALYPAGYHCDPKQPLPFLSIASQKKHVAIYHMGLYANKELWGWFEQTYISKIQKKPDMSKSCIRFKPNQTIPYDLIAELTAKLTVKDYIALYESNLKKQ